MIRALAWIGGLTLAFWIAGMFGWMDYKVCVSAPGECAIYIKGERVDQ